MNIQERGWFDPISSQLESVAGPCDHGNGFLVFAQSRNFLTSWEVISFSKAPYHRYLWCY